MDYLELLAQVQAHPQGADYHALRMAYVRSEHYFPYANDTENVEALRAALHAENLPAALEAVENMLGLNYLDIEAHIAADYIYTRLEDAAQSAYHRTFARGLIDAALATGDGRSAETAFIVLDVPEEYTLLRIMGFKPKGQALLLHNGHWIDQLDVEHAEKAAPKQVYFNVDLPRNWLESHHSEEPGPPSEP